ncbi:MAG: EAL domain-containing protein [Thermomicrobiales bacterium]
MNVLLFEPDGHTRTALEMVLALRGHHIELCHSIDQLHEKLELTTFEFVLYGIETLSPEVINRLRTIRTESLPRSSMLIGIIDEREVANLAPDVMEQINQVLVRPLDLDMLDLQFEAFEQAAHSRKVDNYALSMPQVPADALAKLADRGIELGILLDDQGRIQFTTSGVQFITGHNPRSFHGRSVLSLIHPDDRPNISRILSDGQEEAGTTARVMGDGEQNTWFDLTITRFSTGLQSGSFVMVGHRTSRRSARPVEPDTSRYGEELVAHINQMGEIGFRTEALAKLLDIPERESPAQFEDYILESDISDFRDCIDNLPDSTAGQSRCHVRIRTPNQRWRTLELVCTNLLGIEGIDTIVINAHDVTNRKSLEQHLMRRAFLDSLTGLPNRSYFLSRLERALGRTNETGARVAVLFLDLDRFKLINDSLGHEIGDQLLVAVGQRLKTAVRPGDIVARFGGDELIVLLEEIDGPEEAIAVADRIIQEVRDPLVVGNHEISISTSVGIATSDPDVVDANILIRNADIALYRAKELGASRYIVFDESMAQRVVERLEMETDLRHAIEGNQLSIEFLPELDLRDGRLAAVEVLTRWHHPEHGEITPAMFMEVAEESGLIVRIGRWAFTEACRCARSWQEQHPGANQVLIAINMSVREFQQPDLVEFISSTLDEYGIPPRRLRIEIDERSLAADPDDTLAKVQTLRQMGICFAIDNFGRGFSSLSLFTRFTFDLLKVDRQFISGNDRAVRNLSVVRAVTSLAHALGMQISAEGIETREQLARARAAGCDFGQGYLFARSLDVNTTEALFLSTGFNEAA